MREGFEKYERIISKCSTEEYKKNHKYCPMCGCSAGSQTLMGYLGDEDHNIWDCSNCHWNGTIHGKVAEPVKKCECKYCIDK